jgi:hypothetical protein
MEDLPLLVRYYRNPKIIARKPEMTDYGTVLAMHRRLYPQATHEAIKVFQEAWRCDERTAKGLIDGTITVKTMPGGKGRYVPAVSPDGDAVAR